MSEQAQDINFKIPDFRSPAEMLEWSGTVFVELFRQTRNAKAPSRARLLTQFLAAWNQVYSKYADNEGLQELKRRLEALENEKGLRMVK